MTLLEKEYIARYPKILKHGDRIKIHGKNLICQTADIAGNSPGVGLIWVKIEDSYVEDGVETWEENGEIKSQPKIKSIRYTDMYGYVSIFTGQFHSVCDMPPHCVQGIEDVAQLVRLYHELFSTKTLFQRLKIFLAKLLKM
jgi:hypothetical protein